MELNQSLSWKFLLPIGAILWFLFYGAIWQLLGSIIFLMGIIDLGRQIIKKFKKN